MKDEQNKLYDDDGYIIIDDFDEFDEWCKDGGWDNAENFEFTTGVSFDEIKGISFLIIHNRIFTK